MSDPEGASPRERILEACRRDQDDLLHEVIDELDKSLDAEALAKLVNEIKDSMGNYALHICAQYGSYDVMDALFDIPGFECDPLTRLDSDAPLHTAVRFANEKDAQVGQAMIEMMCEAGCDPRVRNKHGSKAVDLVEPRNEELKKVLRDAEYVLQEGLAGVHGNGNSDFVQEEDGDSVHDSASDSE